MASGLDGLSRIGWQVPGTMKRSVDLLSSNVLPSGSAWSNPNLRHKLYRIYSVVIDEHLSIYRIYPVMLFSGYSAFIVVLQNISIDG